MLRMSQVRSLRSFALTASKNRSLKQDTILHWLSLARKVFLINGEIAASEQGTLATRLLHTDEIKTGYTDLLKNGYIQEFGKIRKLNPIR